MQNVIQKKRQMDGSTEEGQTGRQTENQQRDGWTNREAGRQTGKQTEGRTDRGRYYNIIIV